MTCNRTLKHYTVRGLLLDLREYKRPVIAYDTKDMARKLMGAGDVLSIDTYTRKEL